jgi:hypothetical protein
MTWREGYLWFGRLAMPTASSADGIVAEGEEKRSREEEGGTRERSGDVEV